MKIKTITILLFTTILLSLNSFGQETSSVNITSFLDEQHYNRAINIMAMLLVGFGFLMVFVRKYGRSALTATFLLTSISLPLYFLIKSTGIVGEESEEITKMILAEFGAASLLIAAGAVLGRIKMPQYLLLGLLFIPFYMLNEWIVLDNGLGIIPKGGVLDTGGSIIIHAFGAIFGLGVALTMTTKQEFEKTIEADATSDRYSMLGSMMLWIFWPSFCAALVTPEEMPHTVVNVILALCGSTLATYLFSVSLRKKISIADIANAALAGGVAIGSTCVIASHTMAVIIGILAGGLSTFGFAIIQSRQQKWMKLIDTCGVTNLHGLPGLFGGLAALPLIQGINIKSQLFGIVITIVIAFLAGLITGKILPIFGRKKEAYEDAEEFLEAE
ncbi:MAG: ammonium transporter [Bacteroidetes bacterium CG02_land_8_20_14_3_00_31_25]|nr:ammonium transporter [Bacteroidota bacterium]PIV57683.1 MAG: ammonium transporter [Bacteroidetes bacterium CG02_land_8_20_14_3_00_31_25]PIX35666.1 MAG: ammonium transporter [Bacteroidetes bacterium CG_4_8_14_3_um_filter_31_14]PIY05469.1 MAG: ammonium transporter [Bacteroidetes bacterium CG_4_10_14_3_um_filter_31_20]